MNEVRMSYPPLHPARRSIQKSENNPFQDISIGLLWGQQLFRNFQSGNTILVSKLVSCGCFLQDQTRHLDRTRRQVAPRACQQARPNCDFIGSSSYWSYCIFFFWENQFWFNLGNFWLKAVLVHKQVLGCQVIRADVQCLFIRTKIRSNQYSIQYYAINK